MLPCKTGDLTFECGSIFFPCMEFNTTHKKKSSQEHSMETWEDMAMSHVQLIKMLNKETGI